MTTSKTISVAEQMMRKRLGRVLRNRRIDLGMTQRDVAKRAGLDYYNNVSNYERGTKRIPYDRARPIADTLEIDKSLFVRATLAIYDPNAFTMIYGEPTTAEKELASLQRPLTGETQD